MSRRQFNFISIIKILGNLNLLEVSKCHELKDNKNTAFENIWSVATLVIRTIFMHIRLVLVIMDNFSCGLSWGFTLTATWVAS